MKRFIYLTIFLTLIFCESSFSQSINAPSNLEAESEDSLYLKVKWDDNSNNEAGFYIERSLDDTTNWEIVGSTLQNSEIYFDYWVTRGRVYYFRVYAYNGSLRSGYSNSASTVLLGDPSIIPAIPTNLVVTDITMSSITINWQDNSNNEDGFIIARKREIDSFYQYIDTVAADILTFQEVGLTPDNIYTYKICSYITRGISEYSNSVTARTEKNTSVINNLSQIPEKFNLGNNYPNPFNPTTNIKFGISSNSFVKITIYNSLGTEVENLVSEFLGAGSYLVTWNAHNYTSGVYFYRLSANYSASGLKEYNEVKKMLLIK
ncbi:MAG: T9SS type A sorting domain-containing protein [Ignavibacteria bacterium]